MRSGDFKLRGARGFTLLELLVVLAIMALLVTLVSPQYFTGMTKAEEETLKENLRTVRDALDKFYSDTGRYPESLNELVERRYLRTLPFDPMTESDETWVLVQTRQEKSIGIRDLHSGSTATARDGTTYDTW